MPGSLHHSRRIVNFQGQRVTREAPAHSGLVFFCSLRPLCVRSLPQEVRDGFGLGLNGSGGMRRTKAYVVSESRVVGDRQGEEGR